MSTTKMFRSALAIAVLAACAGVHAQDAQSAPSVDSIIESLKADAPAEDAGQTRALRPGAAWVQATPAGIEATGDLAAFAREHGLVFYDAPVLGTRQPAEAGQLTVLAAGLTAVAGWFLMQDGVTISMAIACIAMLVVVVRPRPLSRN